MLDRLNELHADLKVLKLEVEKEFPCVITVGFRSKEDQDKAFADKKSKLQYPNSKHNVYPSNAMDLVPTPVDWEDTKRFYLFGGYVLGVASRLFQEGKIKSKIRWGGDWNSDKQIKDNTFNDLVHFERVA